MPSPRPTPGPVPEPSLEQELREAVADIERGDYIELTPEQIERCIQGEWPWPDEYPG